MIVFTWEHCISLEYMIFIYIYERKLYNTVYIEETSLNIDAPPNTLQIECINVTFRSKNEKCVLLQLTRSVSIITLCVEPTTLAEHENNSHNV